MANRSVKAQEPCPICGKPDWCYWLPTEYGELLCCARTSAEQDTVVTGKDGNTYYVKKPRTAQGFCIYEPAELKQFLYEKWCMENGKTPRAKYAGVGTINFVPNAGKKRPSDEELSDRIANPERLDEVYRTFLGLLKLEKMDQDSLQAEWYEYYPKLVEKYLIKSMPPADKIRFGLKGKHPFFDMYNLSRKEIMNRLVQKVGEPYGVPGFYINSFNNTWTFASLSGIIFPSFDLKGRIIRLRIRDAFPNCKGNFEGREGEFRFSYKGEWEFTPLGEKKWEVVLSYEKGIHKIALGDNFLPKGSKVVGKYKNFSSFSLMEENGEYKNRFLHGTRSGSMPSVYAEPDDTFYTVYFTEGEKKGMVAHELLKSPVVCFPGVGFYSQMNILSADNFDKKVSTEGGESIIAYMLSKGSRIGVICYDADKETNHNVLQHEQEAVKEFIRSGLYMAIGEWNSGFGKGLDDIALAGVRPTIHPVILR